MAVLVAVLPLPLSLKTNKTMGVIQEYMYYFAVMITTELLTMQEKQKILNYF
jgi:hypothetical protein